MNELHYSVLIWILAEAQLHVDKIAYTGINLLSVKDTTSYKEWSAQYDLDNPINPEDLPERTVEKYSC